MKKKKCIFSEITGKYICLALEFLKWTILEEGMINVFNQGHYAWFGMCNAFEILFYDFMLMIHTVQKELNWIAWVK